MSLVSDTHGRVADRIYDGNLQPGDTLIILGDNGLNFFLDERDKREKEHVQTSGVNVYCLRGNHDVRPQTLLTMERIYDDEVEQFVYLEPTYPNIRYLIDGSIYQFGDYSALVIGGAYSVDRDLRLKKIRKDGWCGWWPDEQLYECEKEKILDQINSLEVDFIFTHTCPLEFQPKDLFLLFVDQSNVDDSMERFLSEVSKEVDWNIWLFGHYHQDRIERDYVEQFYQNVETLDDIHERWFSEDAKFLQKLKNRRK